MFEIFASYVEMFLNLLELTALVVSVFTFFFLMLNQYSKALRYILGPCGMGFWPRVRALFMCRKSPVKKRAFIEFAILKTQGCPTVPQQWHSIINEFKAFYQEGLATQLYEIPNCTSLIGDELSEATARYFEFFDRKKVRKVFGIHSGTISWVIRVGIEEAYITPTCLLTGLLSKYEENWSEFIKRFVSTAYITENETASHNDILSNELYFTFAWLLWGPSYELSHKKTWAGLCQISFGDESNSVPAVATPEGGTLAALAQRLEANQGRRYGALVNAVVSIHENKWYYRNLRNSINPENSYFYNKVEEGPLSFAVQLDSFVPCESYKAKKYYCTAYVWILFEQEDPNSFTFRPERSVAFFEHANLTDKATYNFLIETLIDKCIRHFETIFSDPAWEGRSYRFVCAMNDQIQDAFLARLSQRCSQGDALAQAFSRRILPEPKHTPAAVFSSFDEYFDQKSSLHFQEVLPTDKNAITDLGIFYTQIYMECFPDPDERETFDSILGYLQEAQGAKDYRYHIVLARDEDEKVVGGAIFDYFPDTNAGVIEFIAIKPDVQSCGAGSQLYRHVLLMLSEDAFRTKRRQLGAIFCEIDSPQYSRSSIKKYLYFWRKHNYRHLDFPYIQPSLSAGQEKVTGLWFTVAPQDGRTAVSGEYVLQVLYDYMKYAMRISDPKAHPDYQEMAAQLLPMKEVPLLPIIET